MPLLLILWDESVICALLAAETRSEDCRRRDCMRPADDRQHLATCMLSAMVSELIDRHPLSTISGSSAELPRITRMSSIEIDDKCYYKFSIIA